MNNSDIESKIREITSKLKKLREISLPLLFDDFAKHQDKCNNLEDVLEKQMKKYQYNNL